VHGRREGVVIDLEKTAWRGFHFGVQERGNTIEFCGKYEWEGMWVWVGWKDHLKR